jgi:hypothetical protein
MKFSIWPVLAIALALHDGVIADEKEITLFYPGQTGWEWVLIPDTHKSGSKLRQGYSCRDCHEGEETDIGDSLLEEGTGPSAFPVNIAMSQSAGILTLSLQWQTSQPGQHSLVSALIGHPELKAVVRGGCWAACHADNRGMPADADLPKYLSGSRSKMSRTGGGDSVKSQDELAQLHSSGHFYELWGADIDGQLVTPRSGYLLDSWHLQETPGITATVVESDDEVTVTLRRPVIASGLRSLQNDVVYPIAFAIHSGNQQGREHRVSLEYSFVLGESKTDDDVEVDFVLAPAK